MKSMIKLADAVATKKSEISDMVFEKVNFTWKIHRVDICCRAPAICLLFSFLYVFYFCYSANL